MPQKKNKAPAQTRDFDVVMRDADASDNLPFLLVLAMFIGFAATAGLQWIAQELNVQPLQTAADFLFNGGMATHAIWEGQLWRGVTSAFLHGGWAHIISNSLATLFAIMMANCYFKGHGWITIFFASQFLGAAATTLWDPQIQAVGASIGLMGLFGASLAAHIRFRGIKPNGRPGNPFISLKSLIIQLVLQFTLEQLVPHVGHSAHAFGLLFGIIIGFILPINAGITLYVTRPAAAKIIMAVRRKPGIQRGFIHAVTVRLADDFNQQCDAVYELKLSRNWRNQVSYVTTVLAGSASAITGAGFEKLATRFTVPALDKEQQDQNVKVEIKQNAETRERTPWFITIPCAAFGLWLWTVFFRWNDMTLDTSGFTWLTQLPARFESPIAWTLAHGGNLMVSGMFAYFLASLLTKFSHGFFQAAKELQQESKTPSSTGRSTR